MPNNFNTIPEALAAIKNGELIIVVDEPDRGERRRSHHGG